jgi:CBS domain-containing protein
MNTILMTILDFMTPITQVIYARPEETIGTCRSIMGKLGVKCLPILSHGRVEGLITSRDMSEYGIDAAERGGKKHYLESVSERVGLSSNTSMAEPPAYIRAHLALRQNPLYMNVGVAELPHPFKTDASCGINRRGKICWYFSHFFYNRILIISII